MFWKILSWVSTVASLILDAEGQFGPGKGPEKREFVQTRAVAELEATSTALQIGSCSVEALMDYAGQVIDGIVGVLNCFGLLGSKPAPEVAASSETSPAPD